VATAELAAASRSIANLLNSLEAAHEMGKQAREQIGTHFSWETLGGVAEAACRRALE